jgi:hypothetical protein
VGVGVGAGGGSSSLGAGNVWCEYPSLFGVGFGEVYAGEGMGCAAP